MFILFSFFFFLVSFIECIPKDSETTAQLWIDGVQVVEVVAGTLAGSGNVELTAGVLHPIEIKMIHNHGPCSIEVGGVYMK